MGFAKWIHSLVRVPDRRRRIRRPVTSCAVQSLERRALLSATQTAVIEDVEIGVGVESAAVILTDHFDDPAIQGSTVQVTTPLGSFFLETADVVTPLTATNFLNLVSGGNYEDMFFHRSLPGFVLQGGGFTFEEGASSNGFVSSNGNVVNEFDNWFDPQLGNQPAGTPINTRGTVAMAKVDGNPDSATTQWFINQANNSESLDGQNGGFTVFAHVLFGGMEVVDNIVSLQRVNAGGVFNNLPVRDYQGGNILRENLVTSSASIVNELAFAVTSNSNPSIVTTSFSDGQLVLTPVAGQSGTAAITVEATDLEGNTVSDTFNVSVSSPPGQSSVTGPTGDSIPVRPEITWSSVSGASTYELWVNQVDGTPAIIREQSLTGTSFTVAEDLSPGAYRAWVRTHNDAGSGPWSSAFTFLVGVSAPQSVSITVPADSAEVSRQPTISWSVDEVATEYDLWVNHVGIQNQVIRESALATNSYQQESDLADGTYRGWVRAKNSAGSSSWSAPITFFVGPPAAPIISGPIGDSIPARPVISWNRPGNAATFELWVNQIGGTARIIHERTLSENSFSAAEDLAAGVYRAWTRATSPGGRVSTWSSAFEFIIGADTSPGATAITSVTNLNTPRPTINWTAADNADRYEVWVNHIGGEPRVIHVTNATGTSFSALQDLQDGNYRVWIRAFNSDNVAGTWSSAFNFAVTIS